MLNNVKTSILNFISDEKFSEILRGSVWSLGTRVLATGITFLSTMIIARFYGAEILGILAIVQSIFVITTIFTLVGTHNSILRLIPEHIAKYSPSSAFRVYRKTQFLVAALSILSGGALYLLSTPLAEGVFAKPHLSFYFALASFFVLFYSIMTLNTQAVRGLRLNRTFAMMQALPSLSKFIVLVTLTLTLFQPENPAYALFSSYLITAVVGVLIMDFAFKKKIQPTDSINFASTSSILKVSVPMFLTSTMTFIIGQTGVILLGIFHNESEVGYYDIAVKMATLTSFILNSINSMAAPNFSDLYHKGKIEDLFYIAKKSSKLIFWTTVPILLLLILLGNHVLLLLYGEEFSKSYMPMVILIFGHFVSSISGSTTNFMNMTGNHTSLRNIMMYTLLLSILLNILFIQKFGVTGAAIAGSICISFSNITTLIFIKIKYKKTIGYFPIINKFFN